MYFKLKNAFSVIFALDEITSGAKWQCIYFQNCRFQVCCMFLKCDEAVILVKMRSLCIRFV